MMSGKEKVALYSPFGLYLLAVAQAALCVAFIGVMIYFGLKEAQAWPFWAIGLPLFGGFLILFAYALAKSVQTIRTYRNSSAIKMPAIILSKRTSGRRSQYYHVTFEHEDGKQEEVDVWEYELFRQMNVNDMGVLVFRGPVVVGFLRVTI
ncbi:hypothetical protein LOC68_21375 [Blastopirellula sp. JC732]|uniref:DUF2500 domain-containing protein n=1 Tax=Blastopirellula sediminis TaxID=2894196 RepID=A0A9X1MSS4_9BACT|nr:hypothetical protein [Blastopirellula sediminis]MCC9630949.1 hypothetical protein [Blastopirellula sediminis]